MNPVYKWMKRKIEDAEAKEDRGKFVIGVIAKSIAFVDASLLLVDPGEFRKQATRLRSNLYFAGVVDFLATRFALESDEMAALAYATLTRSGISDDQVKWFVGEIPKLSADPANVEILNEGGNAIRRVIDNADDKAFLRLSRLIASWNS